MVVVILLNISNADTFDNANIFKEIVQDSFFQEGIIN